MGSASQVWEGGKAFQEKISPFRFYTILENEPAGDDADNDAVEQEGPEGLLDDHAFAAGGPTTAQTATTLWMQIMLPMPPPTA